MGSTTRAKGPLKKEGDKLAAAVGERPQVQPSDGEPRPAEQSLKREGDKLSKSVQNALGGGGVR